MAAAAPSSGPGGAGNHLVERARQRLPAAGAERASIRGELPTSGVARAHVAQRGEVEEGVGNGPRDEHLERIEVPHVITLVLEDGIELAGRRPLEERPAHRHARPQRPVREREGLVGVHQADALAQPGPLRRARELVRHRQLEIADVPREPEGGAGLGEQRPESERRPDGDRREKDGRRHERPPVARSSPEALGPEPHEQEREQQADADAQQLVRDERGSQESEEAALAGIGPHVSSASSRSSRRRVSGSARASSTKWATAAGPKSRITSRTAIAAASSTAAA